jgi:phosphoglycolate phosphatase
MAHRFKLLAFDFDGTLMDSQRDIIFCMQKAFETFDLPVPDAEVIRQQVGLNLQEIMERMLPERGLDFHFEMAETYRGFFLDRRLKDQLEEGLFSGIPEVLAKFSKPDVFMAICDGKNLIDLKPALEKHGLNSLFHSLHTPDTAPGKPNLGMLLDAMAFSATPVEETVMIGDTSYDMEMAQNAGVTAVGVSWGYHSDEQLTSSGAVAIAHTVAELPAILESL